MNGMQISKAHNTDKPFPGCLGRMVNLFDLSTGVSGNKLLTEKPHHDGNFLLYNLLFIGNQWHILILCGSSSKIKIILHLMLTVLLQLLLFPLLPYVSRF